MKFKYTNNGEKKVFFSEPVIIEADTITKADKKFTELTSYKPVKCPWIGCTIIKEIP